MKEINRVIQVPLLVVVFLVWIAAAYSLGAMLLLPHTVENGESINKAFTDASSYVEVFSQRNGRLPTNNELNLRKTNATAGTRAWIVEIDTHLKVGENAHQGGNVVSSERYTLSIWRGEWYEHYVPSSKKSTVDSAFGLYLWRSGFTVFCGMLGWFLLRVTRTIQARPRRLQP
jgi:hypothetical protein